MTLSPTSSRGVGPLANVDFPVKEPVRVATTGNIALTGLQTIDGVTVSAGDRVLVWLQTTATDNGVYVAAAGAWARSTDCPDNASMLNCLVVTGYDGNQQFGAVFYNQEADGFGIYFNPVATNSWIQVKLAGLAKISTSASAFLQGIYQYGDLVAETYTSTSPWRVTTDGYERTGAMAVPADGIIQASEVINSYDATNGAAVFVRKGKTADGTVVQARSPMAPLITSGALPTVALVSGTGAQVALNRDARTVTPVTFNPTGAATATCLVQLSPDNVTYSTLVTKTFPVSVTLVGSVDEVSVVVPAGWYLKLTATNATLGTTTYY